MGKLKAYSSRYSNGLMFRAFEYLSDVRDFNYASFNTLRRYDYMYAQGSWSSLVQVILACHLLETKPLLEPKLSHYQLDSWEQTSDLITKMLHFILGNAYER